MGVPVASVASVAVQVQQGSPTRSRSRSPIERPGDSCSSAPRSRRPDRRASTRALDHSSDHNRAFPSPCCFSGRAASASLPHASRKCCCLCIGFDSQGSNTNV